ncbi:MAG: hypothetical protein ABSD13_17085 [Candidatus Korobacteraceae bacterium]|jgi:invasion protein IalB
MKRALLVILGGLVTTVLLMSAGTEIVLILSPGWKAVVTQTSKGYDSMMISLLNSLKALVAFVYIPTALLVGYLVGLFSRKRKISSAFIATCPAWGPLVAVPPWGTLISILIGSAAVIGAWLSTRAGALKPS